MEQTLQTIEAFAHYIRGVITLFFVSSCLKLYIYKRRSRMMRLLYYATLYLTFSHLKDSVFLFAGWKNSMVLNDFVITIDMVFFPLICAFFLEVVSPGRVTKRLLALATAFQASFPVAFLVFRSGIIATFSMATAFAMAIATIVFVLIFSARYRRLIATNYSYRENIDVIWVTVSSVVYFVSLFVYAFAFNQTTWLSESLYNVFSIVFWSFLFIFARRHRVMRVYVQQGKASDTAAEQSGEDETTEEQLATDRDDEIAARLQAYVENGKAYLNPKITLGEVALAIGTNRTYLSDYFNRALNITFLDYMNNFRVAEACGILDAMPQEGRKSMGTVAEMSGFNSKSTFHRYFMKVKGVSPKNYYLARIENNNNL